jgi:PII-like signaling protein
MKISEEGQLLRIFIGETDKWEGMPLYEALIFKAREMGLAGATMLRGLMGYGAASRVHTAKILRLSEDLPVIVEIVDSQERIASFLPIIDEMVQEGLVTLERVQIILYRHNTATAGASL